MSKAECRACRIVGLACILTLVIVVVALCFPGCSVGREIDGQGRAGVMLPFPSDVDRAATGLGTLLGSLWGPQGAAIGGTIATGLVGLVYGRKRGEDKGWDARDAHQAVIDHTYDLARAEAAAASRVPAVAIPAVPQATGA